MSFLSDKQRVIRVLTSRTVSPLNEEIDSVINSFTNEKGDEINYIVGGMFFDEPEF